MKYLNHDQLIAEYRESVSARMRMRRILIAVAFSFFVLFGVSLWRSGTEFASKGIQSVQSEIKENVHANSDRYAKSLSFAAEGILSAYKDAALKQFEKDLPKLETIADKELSQLNTFTQNRWKDFERELVEMSSDHEKIIQEELQKVLTEERMNEIALQYGHEINNRVSTFLKTSFGEHLRVGEQIAMNLNRITEIEPEIHHPVDVNESLGLLLELAGLELQELSRL